MSSLTSLKKDKNDAGDNNYGSIVDTTTEEKVRLLGGDESREEQDVFDTSSMWSRLVFGWLGPILELGYTKHQLDPDDLNLIPLPFKDRTDNVINEFNKAWQQQQNKRSSSRAATDANSSDTTDSTGSRDDNPSLAFTLIRAFGWDFVKAGGLKVCNDVLQFVGPQVLNSMIQFVRNPNAPMWHGFALTAIVTVSQILMSLCLRHHFFILYRIGLRVRTAVVMAVYKKSLTIGSRKDKSTGEITNLMSIDAQRLQGVVLYLHALWSATFQICLSLFFLWQQLGPSCLAGVGVIFLSMPLTAVTASWMGRLQRKLMKVKDERIEINNEVLGNMKIVKLQAWEEPFLLKIESLRKAELSQLWKYLIGRSVFFLLFSSVPLLVALVTFAAYVLAGNALDVASALTALALFDILRFPLFMLPNVINTMVESGVALQRIASFLNAEDHSPIGRGNLLETEIGVDMIDATFVYEISKQPSDKNDNNENGVKDDKLQNNEVDKEEDENDVLLLTALEGINFSCREGEFIVVVGAVGSGKSSFLKAILGEVRRQSGEVSLNGKLSYFQQDPFIMNDTVKGNILFGSSRDDSELNRPLYDEAISACSLEHDLKLLPNGDMCEIGEKGITLSGGQKARIAMGRAVYHNADMFLLDDPLAAVDAHVGRHIFEKCIVDVMLCGGKETNNKRILNKNSKAKKKRTVILVTNALQYLSHPLVDKIIFLQEGRIVEQGSFDELKGKQNLKSFLDSFNKSRTEASTGKNENVAVPTPEIPLVRGTSPARTVSDGTLRLSKEANSRRTASEDGPSRRQSVPFNLETPSSGKRKRRSSLSDVIVPRRSITECEMQEELEAVIAEVEEDNEAAAAVQNLMTDEFQERETGKVGAKVYGSWARAAGGLWTAFFVLFLFILAEFITILTKWWLTYWSENGGEGGSVSQERFLGIYALINMFAVVAQFVRMVAIMFFGLIASRTLFKRVLGRVLKAPMSFFDTTPLGRIINRFGKDIYTLDEELPTTFSSFLSTSFSVLSTLVVVSSVTPIFALCLIPVLYFYRKEQLYYTGAYRELKRLDSVNRSPIYALFGETLDGVSSIRAFGAQVPLLRRMVSMVDRQQHAYFLTCTAQCWLGVRLECLGTSIIFFACLAAVLERNAGDETFAGLAGLSISYALTVTAQLNWSVRMSSDFEANMVAVERIEQYCELENEAPHHTAMDDTIDPKWPQSGIVEFKNAKLRYREGLPLVLKGLNISIPSHSKVGIVGRTGAGKSTLMTAILRLVELAEGQILIDGVDTHKLGLAKVRSKIAVIPQDPVLFSGTIQMNLDPFDEYGEERLFQVLSSVGLTDAAVKSLSDPVLDGGSNFSVGEKQLLVIARALLHGAGVVICDEATAAIDAETDARIQRVLRNDFSNATCLTVAHRLNTIMDSDFILAMDDGQAAEFDTPSKLLSKKGGLFKSLVDTYEKEHSK